MLVCASILESSLGLHHTGCLDYISSRYPKYFYFFMAVSDMLFLVRVELNFVINSHVAKHDNFDIYFFFCLSPEDL